MKQLSKHVRSNALALFKLFMQHFRGTARYVSSGSGGDLSIWDKGSRTACATNCSGLVELLREAGLPARDVRTASRNFITAEIGDTFIDSNTKGNVRMPGKTFAKTGGFFFSDHWIVEVGDRLLYLDPT